MDADDDMTARDQVAERLEETLRQRYAVEEERDALRAEVEGLRKALGQVECITAVAAVANPDSAMGRINALVARALAKGGE